MKQQIRKWQTPNCSTGGVFLAARQTRLILSKSPKSRVCTGSCAHCSRGAAWHSQQKDPMELPKAGGRGSFREAPGCPLPPVTNGCCHPLCSKGPLAMRAVCIQSTLCFYRPVEPKIARLLNPRLTSVWLQPHFLEPKSFLTTTQ